MVLNGQSPRNGAVARIQTSPGVATCVNPDRPGDNPSAAKCPHVNVHPAAPRGRAGCVIDHYCAAPDHGPTAICTRRSESQDTATLFNHPAAKLFGVRVL